MVGWMDDEALHRTLTSGRVTFWSRSRQEYWRKGDTSGHVQHVRSVALDCDGDAAAGHGRPGRRGLPHRQPAAASTAATSAPSACDRGTRVSAGPGPRAGWRLAAARTRSASWLATAGSSPSSGGCWPTPRRRSACTASSSHDRPGTFLLESAEHGGVWSRYSIVGAAVPRHADRGGRSGALARRAAGRRAHRRPRARRARQTLEALHTPRLPGLPPLTGGMVGVIGYDAVRHWERLPDARRRRARRAAADDVAGHRRRGARPRRRHAAAGRERGELRRHRRAGRRGVGRRGVAARPDDRRAGAARGLDGRRHATCRTSVRAARAHRPRRLPGGGARRPAGDPRRRGVPGRALAAVRPGLPGRRARRVPRACAPSNPSPYMYLFRCPTPDGTGLDVVGSSPEALVKVQDGRVLSHPIAGTRPRGDKPEEDVWLAEDLLADVKERSRAPDARRPRAQRPGPRLRARQRRGRRLHEPSSATATSCTWSRP